MDIPYDNITALRTELYHGGMPSPKSRSTTDIVWTCLATIILCVYTAVHLNIPEPGEPSRWQTIRRIKWVVIAILAPEIVLQSAWKQYITARALQKSLQDHIHTLRGSRSRSSLDRPRSQDSLIPADPEAGESTHELTENGDDLANKNSTSETVKEISDVPKESDITLTYAFYVVMGGFRLKLTDGPYSGRSFCMTPRAVDQLARDHSLFWDIQTFSIQDKSKADGLAKLLTVLQVLWMLIQCIARKVFSLPITLLELHTFIHATCGAILFAIWFKKPLDVRDATTKICPASLVTDVSEQVQKWHEPKDDWSYVVRRQLNFGQAQLEKLHEQYFGMSVNQVFLTGEGFRVVSHRHRALDRGVAFAVQLIYGAFHLVAWHQHFPSEVEKWLWRASCITIASALLVLVLSALLLIPLSEICEGLSSSFLHSIILPVAELICFVMATTLFVVWIAARVFIVVESFISLRSVPIGVYVAIPWSNYVPHI